MTEGSAPGTGSDLSRSTLRPTLPRKQYWGPLPTSGRGVSLPPFIKSNAEAKNMWSYTATPLYVFMASFIIKHRNIRAFFRETKQTNAYSPEVTTPAKNGQ